MHISRSILAVCLIKVLSNFVFVFHINVLQKSKLTHAAMLPAAILYRNAELRVRASLFVIVNTLYVLVSMTQCVELMAKLIPPSV